MKSIVKELIDYLKYQEEIFLYCYYLDTFNMGYGEGVYYQYFPFKKPRKEIEFKL